MSAFSWHKARPSISRKSGLKCLTVILLLSILSPNISGAAAGSVQQDSTPGHIYYQTETVIQRFSRSNTGYLGGFEDESQFQAPPGENGQGLIQAVLTTPNDGL